MSDIAYLSIFILLALIVAAYYLRVRRDQVGKSSSDGQSIKSGWLRWSNFAVIVSILLLVLGFFMLRSVFMLWIGAGILITALVLGQFIKNVK